MNTLLKITLAATLTLMSVSETAAQWGKNKTIKGNGAITTKTITTQSYDAIKIVGPMDVYLIKGAEGSIKVTTDENLQEYIIVESNGGTLTLKIEKSVNLKSRKGIHISVPFESINNVSLTGSGDVTSKDMINCSSFEAQLTGSGDMTLDVTATNVDAKITGSGDLKLSGKTKDFEIKLTGSGDFDGARLLSENTQAYISGSGDADVYASNRIKARVHGSGDINYSGNPEHSDTKVSGSGSIDAM